MKPILWSALVLLLIASACNCANILVIDGVASPSHNLWMSEGLSCGLAENGHNVTLLSARSRKSEPNLHALHLRNIYELMSEKTSDAYILIGKASPFIKMPLFIQMFTLVDRIAIENEDFIKLINYPESFKFDAIIFDYGPIFSVLELANRFPDAVLIGASAYPGIDPTNLATSGPNMPSFVPQVYMNGVEDSFASRLQNFVMYFIAHVVENYYVLPKINALVKEKYPNGRHLRDIYKSTKIQLVNHHPITDLPQPVLPSVIPVGGLQIQDPKPLPADLEEIAQKAPKGLVLFSLGTNIQSEFLGEDRLKNIVDALAEFPDYHFLWKIDLSAVKYNLEIPKNVFIRKWLPQNDILGHNKTVLFISHAGGLSTQESSWYGVPMLALPIMFDQFPNAKHVVDTGMGLRLDLLSITKDELSATLAELLSNEKYRKQAKQRSINFQDQPEKPLERAIWWINYVLRNPDVSFLRNAKLAQMNYFAKHSIDVIAFLTILVVLVLFGSFKASCFILCKLFTKRKATLRKKEQ